jgi:cytochrome o ubiquinol oxidase subunit II
MKRLRLVALLAALPLSGCGAIGHGFLAASGPVADAERHLFLIVSGVMLFVIGPVLLMTPIVAWHYRLSNRQTAYRPKWHFSWWIEGLIWIPPTLIVAGLAVLLWTETVRLDPYRPIDRPGPPLPIQAVALDWKWLFIYPDEGIATVNALIVPVGRPVRVSLTSGTVMQSLLIPRLVGQIFAMAGMTTRLNFAADRPGTYLGENTQYNGDGFQAQKFAATAMPAPGFAQWVAQVRQNGRRFDESARAKLFTQSTPKAPIFYADVPKHLFKTILDRYRSGVRAGAAGAWGTRK